MATDDPIIIPLSSPGKREAIPEKTFNEIYILDLAVNSKAMNEQDSIYINLCPFDRATQDRLLTDQRELRIPFWEAVANVPEAMAAFAAVAEAVPALISYLEKKNQA